MGMQPSRRSRTYEELLRDDPEVYRLVFRRPAPPPITDAELRAEWAEAHAVPEAEDGGEAETFPLSCPRCGHETAIIYPRGPHYRADCASCHAYIKFVSKQEVFAHRQSARYIGAG